MQPATRADVTPALPAAGNPVSKYIKHVVVIVQENRSFENFFAGYPGVDAPMFGCAGSPGLKSRRPNASCPVGDSVIPLHASTYVDTDPDLPHNWHSSIADWDNGNMDGFYLAGNHDGAYAYVDHAVIKAYWTMAQQYVLADHMFPTEFGGSFTGHLTLIAGTDNLKPWLAEVDFASAPGDCDAPPGTATATINRFRHESRSTGPFPCFNEFRTMAQDLDTAGVSWKYYATKLLDAGLWEPFEAIKYVRYGDDWHKSVIAPETRILTDPGDAKLAQVSWVSPSKRDSDHPGGGARPRAQGPLWVASIVNAIGESSYWNSTAIIVVWDDWGGFYDNVPPPQLDFRGLGIRVPCLIISPYARRGYVSHTVYEFGSILKFIEETFKLPALGPASEGYTDSRANSVEDSFNFVQKPRKFTPIQSSYPPSYFLSEPPSNEPVDTE
jgi:phospholipase C